MAMDSSTASLHALVQELGHQDHVATDNAAAFVKMFQKLGLSVNTASLARYQSSAAVSAADTPSGGGQWSLQGAPLIDFSPLPRHHQHSSHGDCAEEEYNNLTDSNGYNGSLSSSAAMHTSPRRHNARGELAKGYQRRAEKQRGDPFAGQDIFAPQRFTVRDGYTSVETRSTKRTLIPGRTNGPSLPEAPLKAVGSSGQPSPREIMTAQGHSGKRHGVLERDPALYRLPICPRSLKKTIAGNEFELSTSSRPKGEGPTQQAAVDVAVKQPSGSSLVTGGGATGGAGALPSLQRRFEHTFEVLHASSPRSQANTPRR